MKNLGMTFENLQPLLWVVLCAGLCFLPESDAKMMLIGAALTRVRVKL